MTTALQTSTPALRVIDIVTSDKDKKFAPYQDMANAIIAHVGAHGRCEPEDLIKAGYFSREEISRRWHMSHEMAQIELRLANNLRSTILH